MNHTPASSDPFEMDDAAYLLGALSPVERSQYEQHLQTCASCARSVAELAGLPGMLRRLPLDVVESMDDEGEGAPVDLDEPAPPSVLAGALHRVELEERRERRLRTARWFTTAALGAAAVTVGFIAVVDPGGEPPPAAPPASTAPPPTARLLLEREADTLLSAVVNLREVAWGTKIQLECDYPEDPSVVDTGYSLFVNDTDGGSQQVATWNGLEGKDFVIDAATAVRTGDIASLEVRSLDGTTLLRAEA
jgi:Putative zinc-finger